MGILAECRWPLRAIHCGRRRAASHSCSHWMVSCSVLHYESEMRWASLSGALSLLSCLRGPPRWSLAGVKRGTAESLSVLTRCGGAERREGWGVQCGYLGANTRGRARRKTFKRQGHVCLFHCSSSGLEAVCHLECQLRALSHQ